LTLRGKGGKGGTAGNQGSGRVTLLAIVVPDSISGRKKSASRHKMRPVERLQGPLRVGKGGNNAAGESKKEGKGKKLVSKRRRFQLSL